MNFTEEPEPEIAEVVLCQLQCGYWLILEGETVEAVANTQDEHGMHLLCCGPARLFRNARWTYRSPDDIDPLHGEPVALIRDADGLGFILVPAVLS